MFLFHFKKSCYKDKMNKINKWINIYIYFLFHLTFKITFFFYFTFLFPFKNLYSKSFDAFKKLHSNLKMFFTVDIHTLKIRIV